MGKENVYFEIIAQDYQINPEIQKINETMLALSKEFDVKCFVSNVYFYPLAENKNTQELAMAIKDNLRLFDPMHRTNKTLNHIMSEEEIREICRKNGHMDSQIDQWCQNTVEIADQCHTKIAMGQMLFPKYEAEEHIKNLYAEYGDSMIQNEKQE